MSAPFPWKTVWITGASSGIGLEIARQLAEGGVKVAASARSWPEGARHANIAFFALDVTDAGAVEDCVTRIESTYGGIDLAVLCAGTYEPFEIARTSADIFQRINAVNYLGVTNCVSVLIKLFSARRGGHISWFASVAGYAGLPKAAYYGPTKAALINLAESLKPELEPFGINVSVINPGFVATPMTVVNDFPMPLIMTPQDAARRTIAGLKRGRFEVSYPFALALALKVLRLLPYRLFFVFTRRLRRR